MTRATLAALLALSVVHAPAAAGPQGPGDLVSKDLVERLLAGYGGFGRTTIVEGLPPEFPAELIPDGAVARIAASSPSMRLVLVEAAEFAQADRPRYERKLAAAGWSAAGVGRVQRGLAPSPSAPIGMFCRDGNHATYTASPRREGGWWVHVSVMRFGGRRSCDEPSRGPGSMTSVFEDARMPALASPDESHVASMSGSISDDHQEQEIRLETRLTAADVAAHYAMQLTAHGWKIEEQATVAGMSLIRLSAPLGQNDQPIPAAISTMTLSEGVVTLTLRVFPVRRRP